jgi:MoaA/NifB/PqqE/SkfB family radical SAM enzyme
MKKLIAIENNEFNLQFTVSNKCNYHCRYCAPILNNGSAPIISSETYINFFENLFIDNPEILEYDKKFVGLTGGEPTIYEGIDSIIDFFYKKGFNISLDTNGSAKMDFWERNLSKINITNLSVHLRYANFKHALNVVKLGIEKQSIVKIAILMDPEYWDRAMEAVSFFKEHNVPIIEFKGLTFKLGASKLKNGQQRKYYYNTYTDEQLEWIKNNTYHKNIDLYNINPNYQTRNAYIIFDDGTKEKFLGQEAISRNLNKFQGYNCETGKSNLSIHWNGDVRGSHCPINSSFGNLIKDKNLRVKLNKTSTICQYEKCSCVSDIRIKKWINN